MSRVALCVGLNYVGTSAQLAGCVNDAKDWSTKLRDHDYTARTVLEPTKAELVDVLRSMIGALRFGDRFVFTYSGHGTWIPDRSGDEPDGRDEALVPRDFEDGAVLTDDELFAIFGQARFGVRRLIVSDSCHSGTVARFMSPLELPRIHPAGAVPGVYGPGVRARARFLPPSSFLSGEELRRAERVALNDATGTSRTGAVLLAGCGDAEFSYDATFGGRPQGAFTYHALRTLDAARNIGGWHKMIRSRLPGDGTYPQTPQLTALPHQRLWKL